MANLNLLSSVNTVQAPFVKVTFGDNPGYTFGVYQRTKTAKRDKDNFYEAINEVYPNYVKSLQVTKINGKVNTYTLSTIYPVTPDDDPNFFEKIFSSMSKGRRITFSYGDASLPTYIYKNEEAILVDIATDLNIVNSTITYTIKAVSAAYLLNSGTYTFPGGNRKPSDVIKEILYNKKYGLQEIFVGMNNEFIVNKYNLIPGDDKVVTLNTKTNISALEYLLYLVSCMIPSSAPLNNVKQRDIYILSIIDDTTGEFGGTYFKISLASKNVDNSEAYELDVGYATKDLVTSIKISNQENWSIFYDWQKELNNEEYTYRLNDEGEWEKEFAPLVSSKNENYRTRIEDQVWWTKITEYPISVQIRIKGVLRPAILMSYVRLNVYFFGKKFIASGLYIVTQQQDTIAEDGFFTTLNLTRIKGDNDYVN